MMVGRLGSLSCPVGRNEDRKKEELIVKKIIEILVRSGSFAFRSSIKGGGGTVKEQTYYYQYQ